MIVVFDASTFISAAIKTNSIPERALLCAATDPHQLILSREVAREYEDVLFRPKFDRYLTAARRQEMLELVYLVARWVEPTVSVQECADPNDDKYLALAYAAEASMIVSGDVRHLLSMTPWRGIHIVSPGAFLAVGG